MTEATIQLLNDLAEQTHKIQRDNGWWAERDQMLQYGFGIQARIALCGLAMTELAEAIEAVRKAKYGMEKDSFERELAGCIVRIMDIAGAYNLDIGRAYALELEACKARGHMHGGKKA